MAGELDRFAADYAIGDVILAAHAGWDDERTCGSSALVVGEVVPGEVDQPPPPGEVTSTRYVDLSAVRATATPSSAVTRRGVERQADGYVRR
jgi:hypothetical protein